MSFSTEIIKKSNSNNARVTRVKTSHGEFFTPAFMPVGTKAFVNQMAVSDLEQTGTQIILGGNTYHMLCEPGLDIIKSSGGMHKFMGWHKPMLTDSGGYQVFSLAVDKKICVIDENGAHFKHPKTKKFIHLTPKISIETQKIIGADIIMAFDECTPEKGGREAALLALDRTHRWLLESKELHEQNRNSIYGYPQALFGIIQGGNFEDLRLKSAEFIVNMDLDGIALGGEVIGYHIGQTCKIIDWVRPLLPENKIRYTMGVGLNPQDLLDVVAHGIDIFDCVAPTRNARHGSLYHGQVLPKDNWLAFISEEKNNRILIKKQIYATDEKPIIEGCKCWTCQHHSRAYLHYLFKIKSTLYYNLACIHNIHVLNDVCVKMREKINENTILHTR